MTRQDHGYEKFHLAMEGLVTSNDSIQVRLFNVWLSHLYVINPSEIPEETEVRFNKLLEKVSSKGTFEKTIKTFSDEEAQDVAMAILKIYGVICSKINSTDLY